MGRSLLEGSKRRLGDAPFVRQLDDREADVLPACEQVPLAYVARLRR